MYIKLRCADAKTSRTTRRVVVILSSSPSKLPPFICVDIARTHLNVRCVDSTRFDGFYFRTDWIACATCRQHNRDRMNTSLIQPARQPTSHSSRTQTHRWRRARCCDVCASRISWCVFTLGSCVPVRRRAIRIGVRGGGGGAVQLKRDAWRLLCARVCVCVRICHTNTHSQTFTQANV